MKIYILDRMDKASKRLMFWLSEINPDGEIKVIEEITDFMENVMEFRPECCIIRLGNNSLSGLNTAEVISGIDDTIRIILISDKPDFAVDAYEAGVYGYLLSPVDKVKLQSCISSINFCQ